MNTYGEVEVLLHKILEVGGQLHSCPFYRGTKSSGGHWIGASVGRRTSLDTLKDRKPLISSGD
jgi:hypothetical protein